MRTPRAVSRTEEGSADSNAVNMVLQPLSGGVPRDTWSSVSRSSRGNLASAAAAYAIQGESNNGDSSSVSPRRTALLFLGRASTSSVSSSSLSARSGALDWSGHSISEVGCIVSFVFEIYTH